MPNPKNSKRPVGSDALVRRRRKVELRVVSAVADVLRRWQAMFPNNPSDTKQIFAVTNKGQSIAGECLLALDYVATGPHADFDYLAAAESHVLAAERILPPNVQTLPPA